MLRMARTSDMPAIIDNHVVFTINTTNRTPVKQSTTDGTPSETGTSEDMYCGVGAFRPQCMQRFVRLGVFVGVNSATALTTSLLSVYLISQITTIEKQFGLTSAQSGFLLSCNEIGFLSTTLFASYAARKVHIPRILCITTVLYGLSGMICALPYFLSRDAFLKEIDTSGANNSSINASSSGGSNMCVIGSVLVSNVTSCTEESGDDHGVGLPNQYTVTAVALLATGMILQGVVTSPRAAFSTTYIDDNGDRDNTAMHVGILNGVAIFGPAFALAFGGLFSSLYVTLEDVRLSPGHPSWIGAWWLGFLVFGAMSIVTATPLICFPARLKARAASSIPTTYSIQFKSDVILTTIKGFLKALARLARNPLYVSLVSADCVALLLIGGSFAFNAKYVETQFFVLTWQADLLLGIIAVTAASFGSIAGGCIVTKTKLSPLNCTKIMMGVTLVTGLLNCLGFVFGNGVSGHDQSCWESCGCSAEGYFPVCGSDGRNYFSPCVAGCDTQIDQVYSSCRCVGINGTESTGSTATPGLCHSQCRMLPAYLANLAISFFIGTLAVIPGFIVMIRSVDEEDKALAVGLSSFSVTLLGLIPGPIIFGHIVDQACLVWSSSCFSQGACSLYDNDDFRLYIISFTSAPKFIVLPLNILTHILARRRWKLCTYLSSSRSEVDVEVLIQDEEDPDKVQTRYNTFWESVL